MSLFDDTSKKLSEQITIYWSIALWKGRPKVVNYYINKDKIDQEIEIIKNFEKFGNIDDLISISIYKTKTYITEDLLTALLNNKFYDESGNAKHCMILGYDNAELIYNRSFENMP